MLGVSGSAGERLLVETASARNFPSLTSGTAGGTEPKEIGVWPASAEPIAGPPPLKGTCTRSRPSDRRNNAPTRCGGVPVPGDAKLYLPGSALMSATNSPTGCTGSAGLTVSTAGALPAIVTGSKSPAGAQGTFAYRAGLTTWVAPLTRTGYP